jgi:peptidyl-prolyl cis-trans isomerase SurA
MDNTFAASHMDAGMLFAVEKVEPGGISEVVSYKDDDGRNGYRIIKVIQKSPPHKANLQDDYPYIQQLALENKKSDALNDWIREKKKQTFIKIFEPFHTCEFSYDW